MKTSKQAPRIFSRILDDISHSYMLAYQAPAAAQAQWRRIDVAVSGLKKPRIRSKKEYFLD